MGDATVPRKVFSREGMEARGTGVDAAPGCRRHTGSIPPDQFNLSIEHAAGRALPPPAALLHCDYHALTACHGSP